jgi:hypothetical protein
LTIKIDPISTGKLSWKPIRSDRKDDGRWGLHFNALVCYGEEHGHCNVPQPAEFPLKDEHGFDSPCKLGFWVSKQRKNQKNGSLLPDRSFISYYYWYFVVFMSLWLVYMETYGIDFLTPSFVICVSKHHHHHHHHQRVSVARIGR